MFLTSLRITGFDFNQEKAGWRINLHGLWAHKVIGAWWTLIVFWQVAILCRSCVTRHKLVILHKKWRVCWIYREGTIAMRWNNRVFSYRTHLIGLCICNLVIYARNYNHITVLKTKVKGLFYKKETHTHCPVKKTNDPTEQRPLLVMCCGCDRLERRGDNSDNTKRGGCDSVWLRTI